MTRELKLALIVGVTLVLGIAVLISDHLATQRRPKLVTEVGAQPQMAPAVPPAPPPTKVAEPRSNPSLSPSPVEVASETKGGDPVTISQLTPRVSGESGHRQLIEEIKSRGGEVNGSNIQFPNNAKPLVSTVHETSPWADDAPAAPVVSGKTYTVAEGDSAYKIAKQFLGDGMQWKRIVDANPKAFTPNGAVKVGSKLVIPLAETAAPGKAKPSTSKLPPEPVVAKAEAPKPGTTNAKAAKNVKNAAYKVQKGDTLSDIARRQLGSPARADEIAELNRGVIKDVDNLPLGLELKIPSSL
ncbi:MAG: LysM peptidoglycan-binding domain-containing protein [Planctomycetes bacterium]|nr:LysM peptidoglycan-binding domain-containing protein [Planctomycetota bacterium]